MGLIEFCFRGIEWIIDFLSKILVIFYSYFFFLLNIIITTLIILTIFPIKDELISAYVNMNNKYIFIPKISSTIEMILLDVILFVLFSGIYTYFIKDIGLSKEIDVEKMVGNIKKLLSTPFLISIGSILAVTMLTIILDLLASNNEFFINNKERFLDIKCTSNLLKIEDFLVDPIFANHFAFLISNSILLLLIAIAIIAICKLIQIEKKEGM
jgi:hypothetical protein